MSLILTRMQNYRNSMHDIDRWETRPSVYGVFDAFMRQNEAADSMVSAAVRREIARTIGNTIQLPVLQFNDNITIGTSRSATIADAENTSALYTVTWKTYSTGWTQVPTMFDNNEIDLRKDWNNKMQSFLNKLGVMLDNDAAAALEAAKTQVLTEDLGKYSLTSNVVVSPLANQGEFMGDVTILQAGNDFYNTIDMIWNRAGESLVRNVLLEKGQFNTENKTYQYSDKIWHFSNRISNAAGHKATGFAVPSGSLGILHRFEREANRMGRSRTGHEWGTDILPMLGLPCATYYYQSVGDFSGIAGAATADMDRVIKDHYGFAVDVAFIVAYNRDASTVAGPVMKCAVATT